MKIRIKGNSIRFRLTRSEVSALPENESITEIVHFPTGIFSYKIMLGSQDTFQASFQNGQICLYFPIGLIQEWTSTNKVGYKEEFEGLSLLIEKDFTCLDNVEEDQSDNYPNPLLNPRT